MNRNKKELIKDLLRNAIYGQQHCYLNCSSIKTPLTRNPFETDISMLSEHWESIKDWHVKFCYYSKNQTKIPLPNTFC